LKIGTMSFDQLGLAGTPLPVLSLSSPGSSPAFPDVDDPGESFAVSPADPLTDPSQTQASNPLPSAMQT
jgi:hypothetical protein